MMNTVSVWHSKSGSFDNVRRLGYEYGRMPQAYEACSNVVMGIEEGGFQRFVDKDNEETGVALLMSNVGRGCGISGSTTVQPRMQRT
jgi:hypothetical protein